MYYTTYYLPTYATRGEGGILKMYYTYYLPTYATINCAAPVIRYNLF